jgi:transglutaminase-like putative cysteine protease
VRFSRVHRAATFLLAAASALPTAVSGEVSPIAVAALAALAAVGFFLEPPRIDAPRYRRAILAVAGIVLAAQAARVGLGAPVAKVALEYVLVLTGLKLCSRSRFGDYQQIAALAFLNMIGATITTFDLAYAGAFVAFVALAPLVLALSHLRGEMERRFRSDDSSESRGALDRLLASRRVVTPGFVVGIGALSIPVLAMTIALFLGFPRLGLGFFGRLQTSPSVAGMTGEVKIGDLDRDRELETIVARLEPAFAPPPGGWPGALPLKLRGAVFDTYAGDTWKRRRPIDWKPMPRRGDDYRLAPGAAGSDRGPAWDVLLESLDPPYLFAPVGTGRVRTEPVARDGRFEPRALEASAAGMIRYKDDARVGIRFRAFVTGAPPFGSGAEDPEYAALPAGSERRAALAREVAGTGADPDRAARVISWLKRGHAYGFPDPPPAGVRVDPVTRFLFDTKRGTCEHFATAATLMLRAVGIRARFVTGFGSADFNPLGGFYSVRARSAHAWVEAFVDGAWVTLDATPPAPPGQRASAPSTLALALDALRMRWHKYVIGFDINTQVELGSWLLERTRGKGRLGHWHVPWRGVGVGALAAALLFVAFRLLRRRFGGRLGASPGSRRRGRDELAATALYRALDRRLAALGFARPAEVTPLERLAALPPELGAAGSIARRVTERYNAVRFGGDAFATAERERLLRAVRAIGRRG